MLFTTHIIEVSSEYLMLRTSGFLNELEASPRRYVPLEQFCDTVLRAIVGQAR